jgi:hypothetical protein
MPLPRLANSAERIVYRIAGLPIAVKALVAASKARPADPLRSAFTSRYWHPRGVAETSELLGGIILTPIAILASLAWFTWRNGAVIRRRHGKSVPSQLAEQLRLYFSAGVLPPWYYIFSLHDEGAQRAPTFIERFETKTCYFRLLKQRKGTPLNDKTRFAEFCAANGIRSVPTILRLPGDDPQRPLPRRDLFVKPVSGRGGKGAERWDYIGSQSFSGPHGEQLTRSALLRRLVERSRHGPIIVQPRMLPHPDLATMTAGALPTVRVLTCLNTQGEPEVIAGVVRTSLGKNRTVDNLHAGGIGAMIDFELGTLSRATNLGSDARLGWLAVHPDSGAQIEGRILPCWNEVKECAVAAHRKFNDRVVIGWDIAVLEDGPILIEGNGNPDLDILQRFMRVGLREHRFAEMLAHHLRENGKAPADRLKTRALG